MSDGADSAADPRLVESEQRYRAVIENASDMIQSVKPDGTFEFVNRAWLNTLGYKQEEVNGLIVWDVIHPDGMAHCQQLFALAINGDPIDNFTAIFKAKDGRPVPVEGSVTSRFLGDKVVATHGILRDISERLRAQELEARNAQLERERQARYLEKMAALGKLSAGLSHELNNPAAATQRAAGRFAETITKRDAAMRALTGRGLQPAQWQALDQLLVDIRARDAITDTRDPLAISDQESEVEEWLDAHDVADAWDLAPVLVQADIAGDQLDQLAAQLPAEALSDAVSWASETLTIWELSDIISRGSHRISELVNAVKGYSYMDRGAEQIVDIHEGLESTLIILGHRLRNVTVTRDYDRSLPAVQIFGNTLNQVWTNILDNAIDATDGKGTITIRTRDEGDQAVVEIEDNGSGIAPDDLACIFEPFFTTKPQGQGTGLGLDTVWHIVTEEHGGTVTVESAPGRTVFRVTIPCWHAPRAAAAS